MQRILKDLKERIGLPGALAVVRGWGNRSLYVPVKAEDGSPLVLALGLETARRLVEIYGGQTIQIPGERQALLEARNDAILLAVSEGESFERIGCRFGITRQHVGYIVKQAAGLNISSGVTADADA